MASSTPLISAHILVVDDEPASLTFYELTLLRDAYRVDSAESVAQALPSLADRGFAGLINDVRLPDGPQAGALVKTTLFPILMQGERLGVRLHPPRLGEHSRELLESAGFAAAEIDQLMAQSVVT